MKGTQGKIPLLMIALLLGKAALYGQEGNLVWTAKTDWAKGELRLTVEAPVAPSGANLPAADFSAERRIERELPRIFREAAAGLVVDSLNRIQDLLDAEPSLGAALLKTAERGVKGFPVHARNLSRLSVTTTYPLHALLGDFFVRHTAAQEIPRNIRWRPTAEFSGIVIYAKDPLPVHGEPVSARLEPCLYPEIYDDDMNPVLLHGMGDPAYLKRWGSAAYTNSFDEKPWEERIGRTPLRIIAGGLFGKYYTDLKIPRADAERILVNPKNRRLLAEGRILIITNLD